MFAGMVLLLVRNKNFDSDYSKSDQSIQIKSPWCSAEKIKWENLGEIAGDRGSF